jgi:hypothetical protein
LVVWPSTSRSPPVSGRRCWRRSSRSLAQRCLETRDRPTPATRESGATNNSVNPSRSVERAEHTVTNGPGAAGCSPLWPGAPASIDHARIKATGHYARGAITSGGGTLQLTNVSISTARASSAAIAADRGGGTVSATGGTMTTSGYRSPGIYSTGVIKARPRAREDASCSRRGVASPRPAAPQRRGRWAFHTDSHCPVRRARLLGRVVELALRPERHAGRASQKRVETRICAERQDGRAFDCGASMSGQRGLSRVPGLVPSFWEFVA